MRANKAILLRWCVWFLLGNVLLFWLLGMNYISTITWLNTPYLSAHFQKVVKLFAGFAYVGQLGLLALAPGILLIPLAYIFPQRQFIMTTAVLIATIAAMLLGVDSVAYHLFRFHLNGVIIDMLLNGFAGDLFGFSWIEYVLIIGIFLGLLLVETLLAFCLWRYFLNSRFLRHLNVWIVATIGLSLYCSYAMIIYSSGYMLNRVLTADVPRFLPLYVEVFTALLPIKGGKTNIERLAESYLIQPKKVNAPLNYPLQALQCTPNKKPLNLVVIVIDTWRFDMLNKIVTPNVTAFAKSAQVFTQHFSGGNSTGPGIFSLFYGLPPTYWTSMESQHRGPVLIDELLKQKYQMGIFSSATLRLPPFDNTVFAAVKNLRLTSEGKTPYRRDLNVTQGFKDFIARAVKNPQPIFSFLFYDGAHSYCAHNKDLEPFLPAVKKCNRLEMTNTMDPAPYFNRYKNAVLLIDQQIGEVLATLKSNHMLDNTVVLVTADHGEEFNDNHQGFWGHASNFTHFQTQIPLVIHWPGKKPHTFAHQTSHYDVAPTLMKQMLGCQTQPENYSLGTNLFNLTPHPYLIMSSYINFGVVEPERITIVSSAGSYRIERPDATPNPDAKLNIPVLQKVLKDVKRFYKS